MLLAYTISEVAYLLDYRYMLGKIIACTPYAHP